MFVCDLLYIYKYLFMCACIDLYLYIFIYLYLSIYLFIYIYLFIFIYLFISSGYLSGVICAVVSHPADSLVSLMGKAENKGKGFV